MKIYEVGGAVRDALLDKKAKDKDWVVVGSSPEEMVSNGFKPIGKDFPVFIHPTSKEEYALARTERKTGHGYHGFNFYYGKEVTLEEDLLRRDLTINAIAKDSDGNIVDPYGGRDDIKKKIFRHVSDAFSEDPLRAIRLARFNSRNQTTDKKYFVGLASPAAAAIIICYVWLLSDVNADMSSYSTLTFLLIISLSLLMVSNIAYLSFKDVNIKQKVPHLMLFGISLIVSFISFDPPKVLFIFFLLYGLSGPTMFLIRRLRRNGLYESSSTSNAEDKEKPYT